MSRTARLEWTFVAVLLLGCACATAGVMSFVSSAAQAYVLIVIGAVVALLGAIGWTASVKAGARRGG